MKARIPLKSKYSKQMISEMTEIAKDEFRKFVDNDCGISDRRYKKLFAICLSMDDKIAAGYGLKGWSDPWGKKRIERLFDMVEAVSDYLDKHDEISWAHIDQRIAQLGIDMEKETDG